MASNIAVSIIDDLVPALASLLLGNEKGDADADGIRGLKTIRGLHQWSSK